MMQLPKDLTLEFRNQLEQIEQEKLMPYITSVERLAKEEGREEGQEVGLLAGKIQILQGILSLEVESEEVLLSQPIEQLASKLASLQQQFAARQST